MEEEKMVATWTWKEILHLTFEVLNYNLFELDGHPVTLGKLVTAVVMLVMSYLLSRRGAKEVDRRILTRFSVDDSIRYSLRRFTFYFFLCLSTLFTLHTLSVPVTIFTVLGGAVAVGIGFGSQNLVNNFISGVLVMLERPIRVRDFIEVDGVSGQVESIGIRSTIVRTGANAVTLMPNTTFIEKKLTNWTMSGTIACTLRISVAYGTEIPLLNQIFLGVMEEARAILKVPTPSVACVDFGDNALVFELYYNIESASFPIRGTVQSDLRLRLNELFIKHKIEIPFAQRDVRLRLGETVSVKVLN